VPVLACAELGLDLERFDADRASAGVLARIRRDVESGLATGEVVGTPTLFIDGTVHRGPYDAASLLQEVTVP
jgi:protein-disulfide isomerase